MEVEEDPRLTLGLRNSSIRISNILEIAVEALTCEAKQSNNRMIMLLLLDSSMAKEWELNRGHLLMVLCVQTLAMGRHK